MALPSEQVTLLSNVETVAEELDQEQDLTIYPSVNTRLANLRPSKDLLDYYRKKISQYDAEFEELCKKLDSFKSGFQEQESLNCEIRQREEEICQLQKALSDMQVYLFQEREQVLRLYAENDRLKLRELEDRKKIQHLLSLTAAESGGGDITYFHKEPPAKVIIPQYKRPQNSFCNESMSDYGGHREEISLRRIVSSKATKNTGGNSLNTTSDSSVNFPSKISIQQKSSKGTTSRTTGAPKSKKAIVSTSGPPESNQKSEDVEMLKLQIEALQAQMEDQVKLAKVQVTALLEDRKVRQDEQEAMQKRDAARTADLSEQLKSVQELLHAATKEHLDTKMATRQAETKWIHEKDRLLRELDQLRDKLSTSQHRKVEKLSESIHDLEVKSVSQKDTISSLQTQLEQSQKLADMYREQIIQLEDEMSRLREEGDIGKDLFRERTEKMAKRLQLMNQRYEQLEQRRNLEVEGFKNDIRILRTRLKDVERQLYKVTLSFAEPLIREDKDLELLSDVKKTGKRTKHIMEDLHDLKTKIYGLEDDLRKA